eukprot:1136567-Pelagomonas_calceolata.AAC.5
MRPGRQGSKHRPALRSENARKSSCPPPSLAGPARCYGRHSCRALGNRQMQSYFFCLLLCNNKALLACCAPV